MKFGWPGNCAMPPGATGRNSPQRCTSELCDQFGRPHRTASQGRLPSDNHAASESARRALQRSKRGRRNCSGDWTTAGWLTAAAAIVAVAIVARSYVGHADRGDTRAVPPAISQPAVSQPVAVKPVSPVKPGAEIVAAKPIDGPLAGNAPANDKSANHNLVESNGVSNTAASTAVSYTLDDLSRDAKATAHLLVDQLPFEAPAEEWGL